MNLNIDIELIIAIVSLTIGVMSAFFAVYVNIQSSKALNQIKKESQRNQETFQNYLSNFLESNPQVVAANAKKDFLKFLTSNPDILKALTIRPGGIIILASVFDSKFSESEFNKTISDLYSIETDADVEIKKSETIKP